MSDSSSLPSSPKEDLHVVAATPDSQASDSKKAKLFHPDPQDPQQPEAGPSRLPVPGGSVGADGAEGIAVNAVPLAETIEMKEDFYDLRMSWSGKVYELKVGGNDMVYDFRHQVEQLTNVPAERQKIIGLSKGKLSAEMDSVRFGTLGVKDGVKFTMIGTPEADSIKERDHYRLTDIMDDADVVYPSHQRTAKSLFVPPKDDPRNKRLLQQKIRTCPITVMNEPRPGKRLLVLDLDYTIIDTRPLIDGSLPPEECARPGLHDFLEKVYQDYDIVVWSQTHWRYLEGKLVEIGMIGGDRNYKIAFVADRSSMFPVFTERNGQPFKHEVKPLEYFWSNFPQWSAKNSIHIDDLSRNFAMNPGEGLKIRAFHGAGTLDGVNDRELLKLGEYLTGLAQHCEDFTIVDHAHWKSILKKYKASNPSPITPNGSTSGPQP